MALILNIDTTTKVCSVSLTDGGKLIGVLESHDESYTHAEKLHVFIEQLCAMEKVGLKNIDAVSVAEGPGSYTGLRIGVSCAKGLCYALEKPMIAVDPLLSLAIQFKIKHNPAENDAICAMIDARRDEVFMAVYNGKTELLKAESAEIITKNYFNSWPNAAIYLIGDGAPKFEGWFDPRVKIVPIVASAVYNGMLAEEKFNRRKFVDVAYFEPLYGKEFQTTVSKKLL